MKAVMYTQYGPPEVLQVVEVDAPQPNDQQVLVRVHAVSLNPAEWHLRTGKFLPRLMGGGGLLKPKPTISGADFAGVIEAVGKAITGYQPGDAVYGRRAPNGFAEYVCVSERPIMHKPANLSFEQAAAVPVAGITALQSLRYAGQVQPGQKVLINGASGGVGTFTVQIAKAFGAHVTAVCSARNQELVYSLGADHVIDYTKEDFTRSGQMYDRIIDNVGNHPIRSYLRALKPDGVCVIIGYKSIGLMLQHLALGKWISRSGPRKIGTMLAKINKEDMLLLNEMIEAGSVTPVIDRKYALQQVVEAYRYAETGHARGKVVVTLEAG